MNFEVEIRGLDKLISKLESSVRDDVIRRGLSKGTIFMAQWSAENRIANLNPNRKQVLSDKLTARSAYGYKFNIFGQPPSSIEKSGNQYIGRYGTNIKSRGFSYPRLHEFGGRFHRARPVLTPAIQETDNQKKLLDIMTEEINEALK